MAKTVLISGASKGIGKETAKLFAKNGYNVIVNYNKSENDAITLKEELLSYGVKCLIIKADVTKNSEVLSMVDTAIKEFGKIDVLVNNAGISYFSLAQDTNEEDFDRVFNVNTKSVHLLTKAVLPYMIEKKSGVVVNVSSMWGKKGASCESIYSASKSAIIGYTKALSKEVGLSGIRVNAVLPGVIDTDMNKKFSKSDIEELENSTSLARIGKPQEVAEVIYFLASEKSSFITGETIAVDGGFIG